MSFADVSALLGRVAELAAQALQALRQASDRAEDSGRLISESIAGTTQESGASAITAEFEAVRAGALEQCAALEAALRGVEQIRARFEVGATPPEPTWAEVQRSRLPDHITSGFYLDPDGHVELVQSGREADGECERINSYLTARGLFPSHKFAEATKHVEMKVGWRMRQSEVDRVDLVINKDRRW